MCRLINVLNLFTKQPYNILIYEAYYFNSYNLSLLKIDVLKGIYCHLCTIYYPKIMMIITKFLLDFYSEFSRNYLFPLLAFGV